MMNKQELELYIHIPFCARKCKYCDFLSFAAPEREYECYVKKLIEEIGSQKESFCEYRVTTIFVGGGTPSLLSPSLIGEVFAALRQSFVIAEDAEITIEANPGTLTMEKLEAYLACGINRLSLGLQSAKDEELKELGRIHYYDDFLKSYQLARQAGFVNINVDLMAALPGQDLDSWKYTLRKVLMLKPEHISAYSLIIEEGTPFYELYGEDASGLPDEETDRAMYHLTKEMMESYGYERYEISNYAKSGYACRHNIGYWTGVDYLGLGLGASSYIQGHRYHNVEDYGEYMSLDFSEAGAAARDVSALTLEERIEEFMFLGLRLTEGVSGADFTARFGLNMWDLYGEVFDRLEAQGLIEVRKPQVKLTEFGLDVSNRVYEEFLLDRR